MKSLKISSELQVFKGHESSTVTMLFTQENSRGLSRAKQSVLSTELFNKLLLNLLYSTLLYFLVEVYPAGGCRGGGGADSMSC